MNARIDSSGTLNFDTYSGLADLARRELKNNPFLSDKCREEILKWFRYLDDKIEDLLSMDESGLLPTQLPKSYSESGS